MSTVTSEIPAARRRQEDRRAEARSRILDSAVSLMAQKGSGFTLAQVGEAAGYSRGLPAHYFGSKDDLFVAVARHVIDGFRERFRERHQPGAGLEGLISLVEVYFQIAEEDPAAIRTLHELLAHAVDNDRLRDLLGDLAGASRTGFTLELETGMAAGQIHEDIDVPAVAAMILAAMRGVNAMALVDPGLDRAAVGSAFVDMLRRGLAK